MNKAGQLVLPVTLALALIGCAVAAGKILSNVEFMSGSMSRIENRIDKVDEKQTKSLENHAAILTKINELLANQDRRIAVLEARK